jgi:hypothetical protein
LPLGIERDVVGVADFDGGVAENLDLILIKVPQVIASSGDQEVTR